MKAISLLLATAFALAGLSHAELKLPAIFSDSMVLQQKQEDQVWGWDAPGTKVTVSFAGQLKTAEAGKDGRWTVKLDAMPANATPQTMMVKGTSERVLTDILIGEVWMCSGQSNMRFSLKDDWKGELEVMTAKFPQIRLIRVPEVGTQELQDDFKGKWESCTPESAADFSAVGFFYGRYLQQILGVPVGLISNSWSGSAAEAWVRRESLQNDPRFRDTMEGWRKREEQITSATAESDYQVAIEGWKKEAAAAQAEGKTPPRAPDSPKALLTGHARPGNIFNGVVNPTIGYGMKGVIWYQGESNSTRAWEYAKLFPFMIERWRAEWKQGDFPFYWVQLADFREEQAEPGESPWAELRESQTKTLSLPNTGQAVILDLGESNDIHPKNKADVAARLARLALANDYGIRISHRSPVFKSAEIIPGKIKVTLDCDGGALRTRDVSAVRGFAICGADKAWKWAQAKITGDDTLEVWSDKVPEPAAIRYAWADNPACNLLTKDGLPVGTFRSDDFELTTRPKPPEMKASP